MIKGIVKEYDRLKGFGFITGQDGEDYFVHVSGLREYLKRRGLREGQKVSFDIDYDMKGDKALMFELISLFMTLFFYFFCIYPFYQ